MDPTFELEGAILARLRGDVGLTAIVGAGIYDKPPQDTSLYPFVSIGPSDAVTEDFDCIDGMEITMQVDCWSTNVAQGNSSAEVRKLAGAVRKALHKAEISLTANALVTIEHRVTRFFRQEDQTINTAAVTLTALVEVA